MHTVLVGLEGPATPPPPKPGRPIAPRVIVYLLLAALGSAGFAVWATPAVAAPPGEDSAKTVALRAALDAALSDYNNAKGRVDASVGRQGELTEQQKTTEARLVVLQERAGTVASAAYRGQRMHMAAALISSGSPEGLLHAATTVQFLVSRDDRDLRELADTRRRLEQEQQQIADELKLQREQLAIMDTKLKEADAALKKAGGGKTTSGGPTSGKSTTSVAPRNADGSFASESCSVDDPTTTGCITPRMLNAYNAAGAAGVRKYTACFRSGGGGEHPKGRACDFSANASTFANVKATGTDFQNGEALAGFFVTNASKLGVLYVIWYDRIWHPGKGWTGYNSGDGSVAGDHYNHVHLSVQ